MAVGVEGLRVRLRYLFEASSVDSSTASRISDAQPDDSKISKKCNSILYQEKTTIRHMTAVTFLRSTRGVVYDVNVLSQI